VTIVALALTLALGGATQPAGHAPAVPFIEDDYEAALAEARRRDVPVFVEAWAPW
jgi:hypothetical protein